MKRIILHWTGGVNFPNSVDLLHYHFLIDKNGRVYNGKFPVSSNLVCKNDKNGNPLYAAHTGGGNTGSIGVAICGGAGFINKYNIGKYPFSAVQTEKMFSLCAELSIQYGIKITPETVFTHYEFGMKHPESSSFGKIDISFLSPYPQINAQDLGNFIRSKIKWYRLKQNIK